MGSLDLMGSQQSLPLAAYPVGVTSRQLPDVKWDLEGASAGHSLQEKTVIAALMDTITTHNASNTQFIRQPPNPLLALLLIQHVLQLTMVLPVVSSVCATIEEQSQRCVMDLGAAFAALGLKDSTVSAASLDTTRFQTAKLVSVMGLVQRTLLALQTASAFAFPTMWARAVMSVLPVTMDTPTALPASALRRARMATLVTLSRGSACVCPVWWDSSVTAVPLD